MKTLRRQSANRSSKAVALWLLSLLTLLTNTEALHAGEPAALTEQCADAYEMTQRLRHSGELVRAREQAVFCAQSMCPAVLRGDCVKWSAEIEQSIPTVVIEARREDGSSVSAFEVFVDGHVVARAKLGRAFPLDPGEHTFRVTDRDGRAVERREVVVEGVKNRILTMTLPALTPSSPAEHSDATSIPVASYLLGGAGLIGFGSFAFFGLRGSSRQTTLEEQCGPTCPRERGDPIRRDYLVADISLGVGLLAAGLSVWFAFDREPSDKETARGASEVRLVPLRGGTGVVVQRTF
jgi:hypothetical protein